MVEISTKPTTKRTYENYRKKTGNIPSFGEFLDELRKRIGKRGFPLATHGYEIIAHETFVWTACQQRIVVNCEYCTYYLLQIHIMAGIGIKFEEFTDGDIDTYLERLTQHFIALDLSNAENVTKRKAVLLSSVGGKNYRILKDLSFPDNPATKTYEQLEALLRGYFTPKRLEVAERFRFHNYKQLVDQSVSAYAAHLKKLASTCGFVGDQIQVNLRDRFICGLRSENMQRKLLSLELTFQQAVDRALAEEAAAKNVKDMGAMSSSAHSTTQPVHKIHAASPSYQSKRKPTHTSSHPSHRRDAPEARRARCDRCGFDNHKSSECKYKNATCFKCNKVGHLKSECRSGSSRTTHEGTQYKKKVQFINQADTDEDFVNSVFNVDSAIQNIPIQVQMTVSDVDTNLILDTGAPYTLMSIEHYRKNLSHVQLDPSTKKLHVYAGRQLKVHGEIIVSVTYGKQKVTLPIVIVEGVGTQAPPLLGRDWLSRIKLDWPNILASRGMYAMAEHTSASNAHSGLQKLKDKYAPIFGNELGTVKGVTAKLYVDPDATPIFHKARPVPFALRGAVEDELTRLQTEGIITPVDISEWATPLVCVPKADGKVRLCGDYKVTVNRVIQTDQHPIPTPEEICAKISGGQMFSKIDLKCAYQQLVLDEASQNLVTINTLKGLFRYTRLPFGISSSPAIWQRFIDQVLQGLDFGVCVIQDDVLITGRNDEEHLANLEKVFQRFLKFGLRVKPEKCAFLQESVIFFALKVSADGVQPTEEKVMAVRKAPTPTNVHELRSWLGLLNFNAKFIPNISTILHPLNELLGNKEWKWTRKCDLAFQQAKDALTSDTILMHYNPKLPITLVADASPYGLGAAILHEVDGNLKPIAYASRSLGTHEKGYAQIDKEGAAIMFGVQKFRMYLYGRHFTIRSDCKPLERIFGSKCAIPTMAAQRLQRWAIALAAFDYDLKYIPGKDNVLADALSRLPLPVTGKCEDATYSIEEKWLEGLPITSKEIRDATVRDPVLSRVLEYTRSGWPDEVEDLRLKSYFTRKCELSIEQNCVMWGLRVIIPSKFETSILQELHMAHPGMVRMKELARSYVWWPGIDQQIEHMVRSCESCQQHKNIPTVSPMMPWIWPGSPWVRIHIDFAEKNGQSFLLVVDAHSKWPEVCVMNSTTSEATIKELRNIFARHGLPQQVVSDNGPQFRSDLFKEFMSQNGVKHILVSPYHPASNGAVERLVQSFKRSFMSSTTGDVHQRVARFLLTYRSTPHATTGCSPAQLFLGRELRTRLSLLKPSVKDHVTRKQSDQLMNQSKGLTLREFYPGDRVTVKDMRCNNTWWPGTVAERSAPKSYVIVLQDGRIWKRHVDHMRRAEYAGQKHVDNQLVDIPFDTEIVHPANNTEICNRAQIVQPEISVEPVNDNDSSPQDSSVDCKQVSPARRSTRERRAPERLVESM